MERFYSFALSFALIFLIVCLIIIGILMQYHTVGKKFPSRPTVCPDTWEANVEETVCKKGTAGKNPGEVGNTVSDITLSAYPTICEKKKWTKTTGVRWDGVSNYTGCT